MHMFSKDWQTYYSVHTVYMFSQTPLIDDQRREELMKLYRNSPHSSPSSHKDDPYKMAVSLARRLYMLDGFKKSDVASKLADP